MGNLTSMLADMALSIQLQDEYSKLPQEDAAGGVKHEVRVLRSNAWPSKLSTGHAVPCADLLACVRAFEGFYCSKFSGRRLTWAYGTGSVDIGSSCFARRHLFTVSTYQCLILMLFNGQTVFTFKDLCEATKIPAGDCQQQLASLTHQKHSILIQSPSSSEVEDDTEFSLNHEFASDRMKVVLTTVKKEKKCQPTAKVDVQRERKHAMDALIVRIMKARQRLDHNSLLDEVFKQCTLFKPQPQQIKMQIEHLIEREFMRRDPDERNIYIYMS